MSEMPRNESSGSSPPPRAVVRKSRPISIIWLIPIVAALTGGFLAWKAISEQGPTITILFDSADGLQAEKTKIKFKDVVIGSVDEIALTKDLKQVAVTASLVAGSERYLTENTRFWVVRAEISAGQVTGLGTVLGGAYIGVDLAETGKKTKKFVGLEKAPIITSNDEGTLFSLHAESITAINLGTPVFYRSFRVGQVVSSDLDESGAFVHVQVFVRAPYDERVNSETRFWNSSGIDVVVNSEGVQIDTPSVMSMLIGGISFDNFDRHPDGVPIGDSAVFALFKNKDDSMRPHYDRKVRYLVHFEESVSGLTTGSAVEFRGIKLGEVIDVKLVYDTSKRDLTIPIVIELEPDRIEILGERLTVQSDRNMGYLVAEGLRARLATGNLLTGQLKIDLAFVPDVAPGEIRYGGIYPELPTAPGTLDRMATSVANVIAKLDEVPIVEIGEKVERLVGDLETLTTQINRDVAPAITASLAGLESTLDSANAMIGPNSVVTVEVERLLLDLNDMARSMRLLSERLEQHPEDLLRGKNR
jgi:paraquat-inducible protein B